MLSTKVGRYGHNGQKTWDYSAARVAQSAEESLARLHTDYLDLLSVHDVEFADLEQGIHETILAPFNRYCKALRLQADAELLATYRRLHAPGGAWPERTEGMCEIGILNIEIYLLDKQALLLMDAVPDFDHDQAMQTLATQPRQAEWEALVAPFQHTTPDATAAEKWQLLARIYKLGA